MRTTSMLSRLATLLVVVAIPSAVIAAQEPVGGTIRARVAGAGSVTRLPVEQVRAIVAAHLPAVASGASQDNLVTLIFDSNGEFVASGSAKIEGAVMLRAGGAAAGGAAARTRAPGGDSSTAVGAGARVRSAERPGELMQVEGIGAVDPRLVHEMYSVAYDAGEISANAIRLRVIKLNGTSIK